MMYSFLIEYTDGKFSVHSAGSLEKAKEIFADLNPYQLKKAFLMRSKLKENTKTYIRNDFYIIQTFDSLEGILYKVYK